MRKSEYGETVVGLREAKKSDNDDVLVERCVSHRLRVACVSLRFIQRLHNNLRGRRTYICISEIMLTKDLRLGGKNPVGKIRSARNLNLI